ncbi:MAG: hypothetical protein HY758_11735 [Nitrospirae bacterium]|nr:hypothetical protein [Nitrospirota bacterium]
MRVLLIGNFAPPYEEENLYNLSLLQKLEDDGHECAVINISDNAANDKRFINSKNYPDFIIKLLRHCLKKDVVHFSTKGYLRLGLLRLMTSIIICKFLGARPVITLHTEMFSIAGQMRSPVGGRQTIYASFSLADRIICGDKDTFDVASMYMKKTNFELIPAFIYIPEKYANAEFPSLKKLENMDKVIIFSDVEYPSFIFDILISLLADFSLPSNTGIVISASKGSSAELQRVIRTSKGYTGDNFILIAPEDLSSTMSAYSMADVIIRPMSCDGKKLFGSFAVYIKQVSHSGNYLYFPSGLLSVKDGDTTELKTCIINALFCKGSGPAPGPDTDKSYIRIRNIYEGKS